jgi:hypothetical protein
MRKQQMSLWKNNIVEMKETNSFLYEIEIYSMYLNSIKDKWYANWWKMY